MLAQTVNTVGDLLKPLLFSLDPEKAHACAISLLRLQARLPLGGQKPGGKAHSFMGLKFPNRVGLAAGFDKNAECLLAWQKLGFGFAEVGTVTALPQSGNPKPRIFRLPENKALLNRLGFNNDGCEAIAKRISKQRSHQRIRIPIGINIGKSKVVALEDAGEDYLRSFRTLADLSDYMVVNVSSPNTPGLRTLQSLEMLKPLMSCLSEENSRRRTQVPLLLKVSPDLNRESLFQIADLAINFGWKGLIFSNTSTDFSLAPQAERFGQGGISGLPLFDKSTDSLRALSSHIGEKIVLIASGGVMSAVHAKRKFEVGAKLVQLYTGFIYEGPRLIQEIANLKAAL